MALSEPLLRFDAFEADVRTLELRRDGELVPLPQKPFQLLAALLERPGELVTREELRVKLWGPRVVVDFDNGLNAAVNKLRDALEDSAEHPRFIETLPRRGYRFIAAVERVPIAANDAGSVGVDAPGSNLPQSFLQSRSRGLVLWTATLAFSVAVVAAAIFVRPSVPTDGREWAAPSTRTLLAVLPFENLSGSDEGYFSDGLTEELITTLGRLHPDSLGVIARTSASTYRGTTATAAAIGAALGADYLLEGSVRRDGQRVRISVQLVQVSDQTQRWAAQYDRGLSDVLHVQSEIARAVAKEISLEIPIATETRLDARRRVDPSAYDAYLRGLHLVTRRTEESIRSGVAYLQRAIELDRRYAPAYAGLAHAYEVLSSYGDAPPGALIPNAKQAAQDALRLDPGLGEAHAILGVLLSNYDWRWLEAGESFQRAATLEPNSEFVHRQYAAYLSFMGRFDEAIAESQRAIRLDPLSLITNAHHGIVLYRARRYDDAIAHLQTTLELDPNYVLVYVNLGLVHAAAGRPLEAVTAFETGRTLSGNHPDLVGLAGYARALAGERDQAHEALSELLVLSTQRYVSPFIISLINVGLGDKESALDWLERAYDDRVWLMALLKVAPELDALRAEQRFEALLEKMGFPDGAIR